LSGGERRRRRRENQRKADKKRYNELVSQPEPVFSTEEEEEEHALGRLKAQQAWVDDIIVPGEKPDVMPATCLKELPQLWSRVHSSMDVTETTNMFLAFLVSKGQAHCIIRDPDPDPYMPQLSLEIPAALLWELQLEFHRELLYRRAHGTRVAELLKAGQ
jgi:hypothetical protein